MQLKNIAEAAAALVGAERAEAEAGPSSKTDRAQFAAAVALFEMALTDLRRIADAMEIQAMAAVKATDPNCAWNGAATQVLMRRVEELLR